MVIAYLRVSTERQQLANQKAEIEKFALWKNLHIDRWQEEIVSGTKNENKRVLGKVLKNLQKGDILIVSELSRLSRTLLDIVKILLHCIQKDIVIYSIKETYEFSDTLHSKILGIYFGLAAELERDLISMRTKEALKLRKAQGITLGRPRGTCHKLKYLQEHAAEIQELLQKKVKCSDIASMFHVSRSTLFTYLKMISSK